MADPATPMAPAHAVGLSTFATFTRATDIPAIQQPLEICCPDCAKRNKLAAERLTAEAVYSADSVAYRHTKTTATATTTIAATTAATASPTATVVDTATDTGT